MELNASSEKEVQFPFQSAYYAFEGIAKRHHLVLPATLVLQRAISKGENHSGDVYRVVMTGAQGRRYARSNSNKENRVSSKTDASPAKGNTKENGKRGKTVAQDLQAAPAAQAGCHSEVKFYNHDEINEFSYKKGKQVRLGFICKIAPQCETRRKQQDVHSMYDREVLIYTKLISRFRELQSIHNIRDPIQFPRLYSFHLKKTEEFIILEDLKESAYVMHCRQKSADFHHGKLAMTEIGKFHALSFALKIQFPDEYKEFKRMLDNVFPTPVPYQYSSYWENAFDDAVDSLDSGENQLIQKMISFKHDYVQTMYRFATGKLTEPFACVNHGDFWNNNMMFVYKGRNPSKIMLLDFQMARYCSPILDIVYYLFCSTDEEFRRRHYDEMIEIYYKSFNGFVKLLGCDADKVMSNAEFQEELKKHGVFGMCMAIMGLVFFLATEEDDVDMDIMAARTLQNGNQVPQNAVSLAHASRLKYKIRMSAIIRDCHAYGYLPA